MQPKNCLLTGYLLGNETTFSPTLDASIAYENPVIGRVKIALPTAIVFQNNNNFNHPELAGICRNAYEWGEDPPLINEQFISQTMKAMNFPRNFKEKLIHMLKFIYEKGGKNLEQMRFGSARDYTIAYATDQQEFKRLMKYLKDEDLIVATVMNLSAERTEYHNVTLTNKGIREAEKELPKIPLLGLVDQEIKTGDREIDQRINHAKKLFFASPGNLENMCSACEALSHVLEPLRDDCKRHFGRKDTDLFFNLVNDFDIRHNKSFTKDIEYPEQLEWVFYGLLNTINAYTKLLTRLG